MLKNNGKRIAAWMLSVLILFARPSMNILAEGTSQTEETGLSVEISQPATPSQGGKAGQESTASRQNEVHQIEEDSRREDIFQVTLPANTSHVFDFIMDPQELISQTKAAAYGGRRFEEGATLFFRRTDENAEEDYKSSSDMVNIINAGRAAVNVNITADISPDSIAGITMTDDPDFMDDENPSLYLALTDGEETVPINSEYGASIDAWIEGAGDGEYNIYSFQLTGAVNKNGDWSKLRGIAPEVTVTWKVTMDENWMPEEESGKPDENIMLPEKENPVENENVSEKESLAESESTPEKERPAGSESAPEKGSPAESESAPKKESPAEGESLPANEGTEESSSSPANESTEESSSSPANGGTKESSSSPANESTEGNRHSQENKTSGSEESSSDSGNPAGNEETLKNGNGEKREGN